MFHRFMMIFFMSVVFIAGCGPDAPYPVDGGGMGGSESSTSSSTSVNTSTTSTSASTGTGMTCQVGSSCNTTEECGCVSHDPDCEYSECVAHKCAIVPQVQHYPCQAPSYPWKACDGLGHCKQIVADSMCVTAVTDGAVATGCDDGNPCTDDVAQVDGSCKHLFKGLGSACGDGTAVKQCQTGGSGEECCVVPVCHTEGVRAECAEGSVCLGGQCWIACDYIEGNAYLQPGACLTTPWPTCSTLTINGLTRYICNN